MTKAEQLESGLRSMDSGTEVLGFHAPVIGISGNFREGDCTLAQAYYMSIVEAGGSPVVIPSYDNEKALVSLLDTLDGIVLSGGADIDPDYLGEEPLDCISINPRRDNQELMIVRLAVARQIPVLGICRGIQVLTAALGGKLYQDIKTQHDSPCIEHSQTIARGLPSHDVQLVKDSLLYGFFGKESLAVNSFHHQAVKEVPAGFRVTAIAPDGIIEGMESTGYRPILGVQWHPECFILENDRRMMPIFNWIVGQARLFRRAKEFHGKSIILDSHCDSPMFFDEGAHFNQNNPELLVDLHKMTAGRQDASFMVAYIKQEERDEESLKAAVSKADRLLTLIDERIGECKGYAAIATTPDELWQNKFRGIKSIVKGIENGYAIGLDLNNVDRFRSRGVAYMTLCHNGDNDICDSHKGNNEHNGLSEFGRRVVERMNQVGMMVDLSHASEKSFWDALECSSKPIICSHSSSRALCDHTRNLTDDQMRALASSGGVAQVCLYSGFLKKEEDATVEDAVRHIMHMIDIMGINHVGIGSDFDGGGGLPGLEDASWFVSLTERLMAQGLSDEDLSLVWGRNFLNVWNVNIGL
ncbi:MAG: gamma-glutamyl-gamma-aminobutyrate hydrolase family protein [Bacteroidaceae bacterium]|nr:gamma-glutamyl-gamma-aminobutyrate hydrolase family protein [Bacteroidaceae bacterium]